MIDWTYFRSLLEFEGIASYPASCAAISTAWRSAYRSSMSCHRRIRLLRRTRALDLLPIDGFTDVSASWHLINASAKCRVRTWGRSILHLCHISFVWVKPEIRTLGWIHKDGVSFPFAHARQPIMSCVIILMRSEAVSIYYRQLGSNCRI
jgi:hypothetical protein